MTLRPATANDVPAVLPLARRINELHQAWDRQRFGLSEDFLKSYEPWLYKRVGDPNSVFFVAETPEPANGDLIVVAYVVGTVVDEVPIYWMPRCGWIHDIWVEPDYRNEGVGRQLMMLAIEKYRSIGITQLRLQTAACNEIGRKLFAQCGFRACTVEMLMQLD